MRILVAGEDVASFGSLRRGLDGLEKPRVAYVDGHGDRCTEAGLGRV